MKVFCNNIAIYIFSFNNSNESIKAADIIFTEGQNFYDNSKWNNFKPKNIGNIESEIDSSVLNEEVYVDRHHIMKPG